MKQFQHFSETVLEHIPRATLSEQEEITRELLDHLEDHKELLMEYGMSEQEAVQRAVDCMGNPVEIGSAWNKQLSPFWLWVKRISQTLCITLALLMLWPLGYYLFGVYENLSVRGSELPFSDTSDRIPGVFWEQETDIRQEFGQHIIRIYQVTLSEMSQDKAIDGPYFVTVYMVSYPQNPLHYALNLNLLSKVRCGGEESPSGGGGGSGPGYTKWRSSFPVAQGTDTVHLTLDQHNNHFSVEIPLDWGGVL